MPPSSAAFTNGRSRNPWQRTWPTRMLPRSAVLFPVNFRDVFLGKRVVSKSAWTVNATQNRQTFLPFTAEQKCPENFLFFPGLHCSVVHCTTLCCVSMYFPSPGPFFSSISLQSTQKCGFLPQPTPSCSSAATVKIWAGVVAVNCNPEPQNVTVFGNCRFEPGTKFFFSLWTLGGCPLPLG